MRQIEDLKPAGRHPVSCQHTSIQLDTWPTTSDYAIRTRYCEAVSGSEDS